MLKVVRSFLLVAAVLSVPLLVAQPAAAGQGVTVSITAGPGWAWTSTAATADYSKLHCQLSAPGNVMKRVEFLNPTSHKVVASGKFRWVADRTVPFVQSPIYDPSDPSTGGRYQGNCKLEATASLPSGSSFDVYLVRTDGKRVNGVRMTRADMKRLGWRLNTTMERLTGETGSAGRIPGTGASPSRLP